MASIGTFDKCMLQNPCCCLKPNCETKHPHVVVPLPISRRSAIFVSVLPLSLIALPQILLARERRNRKIIPLEDYLTSRRFFSFLFRLLRFLIFVLMVAFIFLLVVSLLYSFSRLFLDCYLPKPMLFRAILKSFWKKKFHGYFSERIYHYLYLRMKPFLFLLLGTYVNLIGIVHESMGIYCFCAILMGWWRIQMCIDLVSIICPICLANSLTDFT